MHVKYFDVLEYFRESHMSSECDQTIKEFQRFDQTYQDMHYYLYTLEKVEDEVKAELSEKIVQVLSEEGCPRTKKVYKGIRERMAHEKFIQAQNLNIELFKYALELIDKEEQEEKQKKKHILKKEPSIFSTLTGIESNLEHIIVNLFYFLLLIGIWMYFRDDFYKYMFGQKTYKPMQPPPR